MADRHYDICMTSICGMWYSMSALLGHDGGVQTCRPQLHLPKNGLGGCENSPVSGEEHARLAPPQRRPCQELGELHRLDWGSL